MDRRRYYEWEAARAGGWSDKEWWWVGLVDEVVRLWEGSDRTYGSPRIYADLIAEGWQVSEKTVAKAMRLVGIQGISPRSWHPTTTRQGDDEEPAPDLVEGVFDRGGINLAWFSDITPSVMLAGQGVHPGDSATCSVSSRVGLRW